MVGSALDSEELSPAPTAEVLLYSLNLGMERGWRRGQIRVAVVGRALDSRELSSAPTAEVLLYSVNLCEGGGKVWRGVWDEGQITVAVGLQCAVLERSEFGTRR